MGRDYQKLDVFHLADELAVETYGTTRDFPSEERFRLQSQIRRAAVSVAANIVEGCSRDSTKDFLHFMRTALGSASEASYLMRLSHKLGFVTKSQLKL